MNKIVCALMTLPLLFGFETVNVTAKPQVISNTVQIETPAPIALCLEEPQEETLEIPMGDTSFKAYMDYRTITSPSSKQYALQQTATTDDFGFRKFESKYMIAVGTYYADSCGETLLVTLEGGHEIECVVADIKNPNDHNATSQYHLVGEDLYNVIEFIVDTNKLPKIAKLYGDVSHICNLSGNIISIKKGGV